MARPEVLHIVTLGPDLTGGRPGPLNVALRQAEALQASGRHVAVWSTYPSRFGLGPIRTVDLDGVDLRLFPRIKIPGSGLAGLMSFRLLLALTRASPALAHVHAARDLVCLPTMWLLQRKGVRFVTQTHGQIAPGRRPKLWIDRLITGRLLAAGQLNFCLQEVEAARLRTATRQELRIRLLPNGVAVSGDWKPVEPPLVSFVAHLRPRKKVLVFVEVARRIVAGHATAQFAVAGPDGGDLAALRNAIASSPSLYGRFEYQGALSHGEAMLLTQQSAVYVLPSVDEPFPMSLLEALAAGVPSICTTGCHIASELEAFGACRVVEPDSESIARAVGDLLSDRNALSAQGSRGREFVKMHLRMSIIVQQLLTYYEEALN